MNKLGRALREMISWNKRNLVFSKLILLGNDLSPGQSGLTLLVLLRGVRCVQQKGCSSITRFHRIMRNNNGTASKENSLMMWNTYFCNKEFARKMTPSTRYKMPSE